MSKPVPRPTLPVIARVDIRGLDDDDRDTIVRAIWRTYLAAPTKPGVIQIEYGP